jgi:putative copper export protein
MLTFKELALFLHVLFACIWVGGMLALVFVVAPVLRGLKNREELFLTLGRRLSFYGTFLSLGGLFITGLINIHYLLGFSQFLDLSNPYTKTLWNKLFAFFCVVGVSLAHDLYFGKRAYERRFNLYMARFLGFLNLILSLLVVFFATKLRLGG